MPVLLLLLATACVDEFQAKYDDPMRAEIIDDRWNETDARKTAEALIKAMLEQPWLKVYQSKNKRRPIFYIDAIQNKTAEHIDTGALVDYLRDELLNSGQIRFINKEQRSKLNEELKYQQSGAVAKKTRAKYGRQIGINYILDGKLSSYEHVRGGLKTVTYQVVLYLTKLETSEIEWSKKHLIKKRFKRRDTKW